ncbi:MAG: T9SS type A sorting domain-containing protein [Bacteroidota bacterium]
MFLRPTYRCALALALFLFSVPLHAQSTEDKRLAAAPAMPNAVANDCEVGRAEAELVVSDVRARLYNMGNLFWRSTAPAYTVPKTGGTNALFAFGIWISGFTNGELRAAASTYGPFEFAPGPLDNDGNAPADCADFDRIWSVDDQDLSRYDDTGIATRDLRDWPVDLGAEVVDGDGNPDNYDLAAGDRPRLFGTQTAFWVMNDVGVPHQRTQSLPLGIEVQVTAWAIASTEAALDQGTYYRYRLVNKSGQPIDEVVLTTFVDADVGNEFEDDYIGSDPARSLMFAYNADNEDLGGYGTPPPAVGVRFLDPAAGAAAYFNSGACDDLCDPQDAEQYRFYQTGRWKDGLPLTVGSTGRTGTEPTSFVYPGEPGTYWSEACPDDPGCGDPIPPSDRRFQISTVPFDLPAGASRDVTFALPFAFGTQNFGPVGNPTGSVQAMKLASDRIQAAFDDGSLFAPAPRPLTLDAPTLLEPADGTLFRIDEDDTPPTLSWAPVAGAEGYQVQVEVVEEETTTTRSFYVTETSFVFNDIVPDNTVFAYRWSVEPDGRLPDGTRTAGERSETRAFSLYRFVPGLAQDGVGLVEIASASGTDPCAGTPDDPGCAGGFGGNTVWHDTDATGDYYVSSGGNTGLLGELDLNRALVQEDEIELRFTAACAEPGACLATYLSSGDGEILSVPFEAWYLGDTPDDPADDLRMLPYFRESGDAPVTDFADTFTGTDNWADGPGAPITERIFLYMPDRPDGYALFNEAARSFGGPGALYDRDADGDAQADLGQDGVACRLQGMYTDYCYRGNGRDRGNSLYNNVVFADAAGDGTTPGVGTVIRFVTTKQQAVSDEGGAPQPQALTLDAYPNPVRGTATLSYTLPESGRATLAVYDVLGRRVAVVTDATQAAGAHTAQLDTNRLASGIYVAVLATEVGQQTRRFTVLR